MILRIRRAVNAHTASRRDLHAEGVVRGKVHGAIIRNPNYLPAHRELAVVYSELGQEKEAGAEAVEVLRISPNFSIEVLRQRLPFKNQAESERYLAALRKAGLK